MPTIHRINSIRIDIYSREHLPPHFHAIYAEWEILIEIGSSQTYAGSLPLRQLRIVLKWLRTNSIRKKLLNIFTELNSHLPL